MVSWPSIQESQIVNFKSPMSPCGILNVNKPPGMTSRQAVNVLERMTRPAKAGHAGTLDPLATGVLVVCVGAATRLIAYVQRMPKRYTGTFLLGRQSPTEDTEGEVTELSGPPIPTWEQLVATAARFVGRIDQRPPVFSALKVAGRPAYALARQGRQPELAPRPVDIHGIEIVAYEYPKLVLDVRCGSGTYIRSLGRDLAESLGTGAVMSALVRTRIGGFSLDEAVDPRELNRGTWVQFLHSPLRAVEYLPHVQLSSDEVRRIRTGLTIDWKGDGGGATTLEGPLAGSSPPTASFKKDRGGKNADLAEIVALDPAGEFVGILTPGVTGQLCTLRNMPVDS
jgi:tRNA pseudouridine55 synthase